jgi:hypothetical protein
MEYFGEEAERMQGEIDESARQIALEIMSVRYKRMQEIKNTCRFCFSSRSDVKCLEMSKLLNYSIDPHESLKIIGVSMNYSEAFNEIICANCFEKVIDFENYRKRCQNAQTELITELEELDRKVLAANCKQVYVRPKMSEEWLNEVTVKDEHNQAEFDVVDGDTDVESFGNENDDNFFDTSPFEESKETEMLAIVKEESEFAFAECSGTQEGEVKASTSKESADIEEFMAQNTNTDLPTVTESQTGPKDLIENSKKPKRRRMFECFFCRLKFVGLGVYNAHVKECSEKKVKCQIPECESYFTNQGGYNQHLRHRHNLPKNFCPICQTSYQMNIIQFDEHRIKCIETNEYKEQQIQCVVCKKICDNLQSYKAHKMLHEKLEEKVSEKLPAAKRNKRGAKDKMCDLCGKVFDASGLQRHKLHVHFVNFTKEMFYCDLCPIAKPTKRLLYNHMKGTHIIRWHACETCGKMFRNRELWRKHQLIHGDFKKNNRCDVCPHRPGFVTKAALNKHMRSNHGGAQPIRKFTCDICKASYSRDDLLIRHRANVHQIYKNNYTDEIINQYIKY